MNSEYAPSKTTIMFLGTLFRKLINSSLKIIVPVGLLGFAKKIIFVLLFIFFNILSHDIPRSFVGANTTLQPDALAIIG